MASKKPYTNPGLLGAFIALMAEFQANVDAGRYDGMTVAGRLARFAPPPKA
jgi:hypothetical protein